MRSASAMQSGPNRLIRAVQEGCAVVSVKALVAVFSVAPSATCVGGTFATRRKIATLACGKRTAVSLAIRRHTKVTESATGTRGP